MPTTLQDPAAQNPDAGVTDVSRSPKERVGGIISALTGSQSGKLDDVINQHHQKRLDQARRSRQEWSTYHSVGLSGVYPEDTTDDQGVAHKAGEALTPQDKARYQSWADSAWADYEKAAGINPQAKKSLQQSKGIIDRVSQLFTQHKEQQQGGLPAPPAAAATPAAPTGSGEASENAPAGGGLPPPPSAQASTRGPSPTQVAAADAPRIQQKLDEERQFKFWKRQQDELAKNKIAENEALAKARAANQRAPRPAGSMTTSVLDARKMASATGKIYKGYDGTPIPIDDMDETMGLKGMTVWDPDKNDWDVRYEPFSPNQKTITVGGETFAVSPMDVSKLATGGAGTDLGAHNIKTKRVTIDPVTNQPTVSVSTPEVTGLKAGSLPAPPSATAPATTPATAAPAGGGTPRPTKAPAAASAPPAPAKAAPAKVDGGITLDKDGLIPADTPGYSPQVIEAANELIQDRDVSKTPAKTQLLGAALARKAGWFQGKWTPQDESRMNQTKVFLEKLRDSDTLKVLDSSTWNRFWVNRANEGQPQHGSLMGDFRNYATTATAKGLTDEEAKLNTLSNQLVSVAAGVSTLTRAGRATNAMIDSIRREMPNVLSTKDSKDAKRRIINLLQEIENAHKIGVGGAAQRRGGGGGLEGPPSAKGGATTPQLSDAARAYVLENHPNVAVP